MRNLLVTLGINFSIHYLQAEWFWHERKSNRNDNSNDRKRICNVNFKCCISNSAELFFLGFQKLRTISLLPHAALSPTDMLVTSFQTVPEEKKQHVCKVKPFWKLASKHRARRYAGRNSSEIMLTQKNSHSKGQNNTEFHKNNKEKSVICNYEVLSASNAV